MHERVVVLIALCFTACSEAARDKSTTDTGGAIVVATTEDPGTLFPPFGTTGSAKEITEQIYDYLADVGSSLDTRNEKDFRRELADGWRWSPDSLSLAFHLNPKARWHDGTSVSARDVRFTFALNKNPDVASRDLTSLADIDSVSVDDSLTARFWFHRREPTQFLNAAAQLLILPAHQLEKLSPQQLREEFPSPIGTGRFRLRRWDKGASVELVADTGNYRGRAKLDRVIWSVTPDGTAAVARLFGGDVDVFEALRPVDVRDAARRKNIRVIVLPGMDYAFLRFNLRDPSNKSRPHPLFGDRTLRRAIAMAINRNALVRSVLDTFAVVPSAPAVRAFPTTDPNVAQIPFDSSHASLLLDSLGWIRKQDGVRAKNGRSFAFTVLVSTSSTNRMKMGVLLQEQLRRMGIRVTLEPMQTVAMRAREERADFDASLASWTMPSSPDGTLDAWGTAGIGKNGVNYGAYSNPRFDALFDSALVADPRRARDAFSAAYRVINDDAPAVWLYEPTKIMGLHSRIRTAQMRPDAWWFSLADWYIAPGDRLPRDLTPAPR
jgi:peptide/nickel transport system substrate-binding protein